MVNSIIQLVTSHRGCVCIFDGAVVQHYGLMVTWAWTVGISVLFTIVSTASVVVSLLVAFIPIPGECRLRLVKNRGGSFVKVVDQNFPLIFHWANLPNYILNKTFPHYFLLLLVFNLHS